MRWWSAADARGAHPRRPPTLASGSHWLGVTGLPRSRSVLTRCGLALTVQMRMPRGVLLALLACAATVCAQKGGGGGGKGGVCADFDDRTAAVNDECCDEKSEDCSSGRPATCNLGCAHVLLPYFDDCAGVLGADGLAPFTDVVALCQAAEAVR